MSEALPGLVVDIEARITKLERGLQKASDKQRQAARQMEADASASADKIGATYTRIGAQADSAFSRISNSFKANSYRISGVATQIGDVATQIGAGTSAMKAFGMQAAQLGGYFGVAGVFAGTAAAALIPLAAGLLKSGDEAEGLKDRLEALKTSTDAATSAVEAASVPLETLRLKYGDLADEVARASGMLAVFAVAAARRDAISAAKGLTNGLDLKEPEVFRNGDGSVNLDRARMAAKDHERELAKLSATTGATGERLDDLRRALNRVASTNSLDAVVKDGENLLSVIDGLYSTATEEQRRYLENWASQIAGVMDSAKRQIEAQKAEDERLVRAYDQNTLTMQQLAADRQLAEEKLTEAKKKGDAEQIDSMTRVVAGIDTQISKMQELARQSDETYKRIQSNMKAAAAEFLASGFEYITGSTPQQFAKDATAGEKGILSLIGQRESGGNYNATLDNGKYTGGPRNLVNMTINEVLAMQRDMLRHPDNHHNSSAAGKYQIVGSTLGGKKMDGSGGLMRELGLTGNELYSPDMQDRLATQLLRRRMAQRGDTITNLRSEWTSLNGVSPVVINDALGRQSIEREDAGVVRDREAAAKRAAEAKDREAAAREKNAKAAEKEAEAQAKSNVAADAAAEAARQALEAQTAGVETLVSLFEAATQGADSLAGALKRIAMQIAETQLKGALKGSGIAGWFGRLLGGGSGDPLTSALAGAGLFAEGGFTGRGGKYEPAGIVHKGEFVVSAAAVKFLGVENLQALHQSALRGYAGGGLVGDTGLARRAVSDSLARPTAAPSITLSPSITVNASGGTPETNADLARQVSAATEKAMRGLIQDELVRQMRPGNVLARR